MMSMNVSDTAILNIKSAHYYCIISRINKIEAINLMRNINLATQKNEKQTYILSHVKMGKEVLRFGQIEIEQNKF